MQWEHMGKTIEVTQRGEFLVRELGDTFRSLEAARTGIEHLARLNDIDLPVLLDNGSPGVVTKVHRGTGHFLVRDAENRPVDHYHDLLFPCAASESLVAQVREVRQRLADLQKQLEPYVLRLPSRYRYEPATSATPPATAHQMHQDALKAYEELRRRFAGGE